VLTQKPSFYAEFAALPDRTRKKATKIIDQLYRTHGRVDGMRKLARVSDAYRVHVDDFRLIYIKRAGDVMILCIRPRKDVYKSLDWIDEEQIGASDSFDDLRPSALGDGANHKNGLLPQDLTSELLASWRIPSPHHAALARCKDEDDLLDARVPYDVLSRVIDLLWPATFTQLENSPSLITPLPSELERYVGGELTTFLLRLDDEQKRIAELNLLGAAGPTLVKGGPGSGKSTVALYRIRRLLEEHAGSMFDAPKILFTTYTNALAKANKDLLKSLLGSGADQVTVATLDKLARRVVSACERVETIIGESNEATWKLLEESKLRAGNLSPVADLSDAYLIEEIFEVLEAQNIATEEAYLAARRHGRQAPLGKERRKAVWRLYEAFLEGMLEQNMQTWEGLKRRAAALVRDGEYAERFDYVIVDEAQDLTPNGMRLVVELSREPWGLYLTADANQSLYNKGHSWTSIHPDLKVTGRTHILKRNYRNTREISLAVRDMLDKIDGSDHEANWVEGGLPGQKPQIVEVTPADEVNTIARVIRNACRQHRQPFTNVAILVAGDQERAATRGVEVAKQLTGSGLKANYMSSNALRLDANCVKVISMHTSKGLEFPVVVIVDMNESVLPRTLTHLPPQEASEEERKDRRLFFVAASRAMRSLTIVAHQNERSRFLDDLPAGTWEHPSPALVASE
jgi:superfamily I DNA/RNA helicase/mRNA-degrading endonuclease RelE of RelBE toxin-antitoxin system